MLFAFTCLLGNHVGKCLVIVQCACFTRPLLKLLDLLGVFFYDFGILGVSGFCSRLQSLWF